MKSSPFKEVVKLWDNKKKREEFFSALKILSNKPSTTESELKTLCENFELKVEINEKRKELRAALITFIEKNANNVELEKIIQYLYQEKKAKNFLSKRRPRWDLLHYLVNYNRVELLNKYLKSRTMISKGQLLSLDSRGKTIIEIAIQSGNNRCLEVLLEQPEIFEIMKIAFNLEKYESYAILLKNTNAFNKIRNYNFTPPGADNANILEVGPNLNGPPIEANPVGAPMELNDSQNIGESNGPPKEANIDEPIGQNPNDNIGPNIRELNDPNIGAPIVSNNIDELIGANPNGAPIDPNISESNDGPNIDELNYPNDAPISPNYVPNIDESIGLKPNDASNGQNNIEGSNLETNYALIDKAASLLNENEIIGSIIKYLSQNSLPVIKENNKYYSTGIYNFSDKERVGILKQLIEYFEIIELNIKFSGIKEDDLKDIISLWKYFRKDEKNLILNDPKKFDNHYNNLIYYLLTGMFNELQNLSEEECQFLVRRKCLEFDDLSPLQIVCYAYQKNPKFEKQNLSNIVQFLLRLGANLRELNRNIINDSLYLTLISMYRRDNNEDYPIHQLINRILLEDPKNRNYILQLEEQFIKNKYIDNRLNSKQETGVLYIASKINEDNQHLLLPIAELLIDKCKSDLNATNNSRQHILTCIGGKGDFENLLKVEKFVCLILEKRKNVKLNYVIPFFQHCFLRYKPLSSEEENQNKLNHFIDCLIGEIGIYSQPISETIQTYFYKYIGHIDNDRISINTKNPISGKDEVTKLEGFKPELFLSIKLCIILGIAMKIGWKEKFSLSKEFTDKYEVLNILAKEFQSTLNTLLYRMDFLYCQELNNNDIIQSHIRKIINDINELKEGEEITINCGWKNHSFYINISRKYENIFIRIDNLGYGAKIKHEIDPKSGKYYPYLLKFELNEFDEGKEGFLYLKELILIRIDSPKEFSQLELLLQDQLGKTEEELKVEMEQEKGRILNRYLEKIYLETKRVKLSDCYEKLDLLLFDLQIVANCVYYNHQVGVCYRFGSKTLFVWFKGKEKREIASLRKEISS